MRILRALGDDDRERLEAEKSSSGSVGVHDVHVAPLDAHHLFGLRVTSMSHGCYSTRKK